MNRELFPRKTMTLELCRWLDDDTFAWIQWFPQKRRLGPFLHDRTIEIYPDDRVVTFEPYAGIDYDDRKTTVVPGAWSAVGNIFTDHWPIESLLDLLMEHCPDIHEVVALFTQDRKVKLL